MIRPQPFSRIAGVSARVNAIPAPRFSSDVARFSGKIERHTVGEARSVAREDLAVALGLLTARHVVGDPALAAQLRAVTLATSHPVDQS